MPRTTTLGPRLPCSRPKPCAILLHGDEPRGGITAHALGRVGAIGRDRPVARADHDATIFEIAGRQHGVVARSQLLQAGIPSHVLEHRLKKGRLEALHRGVYRIGPIASHLEREMAALLACGSRAALSHRTAATLWEVVSPRTAELIDITGPRSLRGRRSGIRLHRAVRLDADEVEQRHGLRVTTPARTLIDLASCVGAGELERALARAERQQIVTHDALAVGLARHARRAGTHLLRALLDRSGEPALTRSEAEERFLQLVRKSGMPPPRVNAILERYEVDFLWRRQGVVVEIDGFVHHAGRAAFERDRDRDVALTAAGFRVMRFTWRHLTGSSERVLVQVAQALVRGGGNSR